MAKTSTLYTLRLLGLTHSGLRTGAQIFIDAALAEGFAIQAAARPESYPAGYEDIFIRLGREPIFYREWPAVYDSLIVAEASCLNPGLAQELAADGFLLVNTRKSQREIAKTVKIRGKLAVFNATEIAAYFLEQPFPSLTLIGAWLKMEPLLPLESLEKACRDRYHNRWPDEVIEKNLIALRMGNNEMAV